MVKLKKRKHVSVLDLFKIANIFLNLFCLGAY